MNRFEKNRLIAMLERKEVPLGMQAFAADPALIEVLGLTGFDFVMLDSEHSHANPRAIEDLIRTAERANVVPFVRVPDRRNATDMRRALEAGAMGLFIPMVRSADDVRFAIDAAYFPPKGDRGICPSIRAANYSFRSFEQYAAWNNQEVLIIPLIEHPDGVDNIEEICALEEVKLVTFGAGDLAYAMGLGTQMMAAPEVQAAYRKVLETAKRHGVYVIGGPILDPTPENCRKALEDGVSVFTLGLDILGFRRFCEQTVKSLNQGIEGSGFTRAAAPASGFKG
jgi:2-keto-3-deoxy-L-rhamnonate aldolase RhmA